MALLEIKEVLRHWLRGRAKRLIARRLGLDVKTVRNYVRTAEELGLAQGPDAALTDEVLFAVVTRVYRRLQRGVRLWHSGSTSLGRATPPLAVCSHDWLNCPHRLGCGDHVVWPFDSEACATVVRCPSNCSSGI